MRMSVCRAEVPLNLAPWLVCPQSVQTEEIHGVLSGIMAGPRFAWSLGKTRIRGKGSVPSCIKRGMAKFHDRGYEQSISTSITSLVHHARTAVTQNV